MKPCLHRRPPMQGQFVEQHQQASAYCNKVSRAVGGTPDHKMSDLVTHLQTSVGSEEAMSTDIHPCGVVSPPSSPGCLRGPLPPLLPGAPHTVHAEDILDAFLICNVCDRVHIWECLQYGWMPRARVIPYPLGNR